MRFVFIDRSQERLADSSDVCKTNYFIASVSFFGCIEQFWRLYSAREPSFSKRFLIFLNGKLRFSSRTRLDLAPLVTRDMFGASSKIKKMVASVTRDRAIF